LTDARSADALQLCPYCTTLTRIEFERGLISIESYLAKWAAFDRWLLSHA
jgi:hypothetical protein